MKNLFAFLTAGAVLVGFWIAPTPSRAANEALTVPVVLADYYGFAYTQAFQDRSYGFAYPTAAVDLLGWGLVAAKKYPGLFCVNLAGVAKTVYPVVILCGKPTREVKLRAWISLGTHAATLLWLKAWSKPALRVESAFRSPDGGVVRLAWDY